MSQSEVSATGDIDEGTGLPATLSLGEVLNDIQLTPGEINDLISVWRTQLDDHGALAVKLRNHGILINDPASYKGGVDPMPPDSMRTAGFVDPAAQAQATTFGTMGTPGLSSPSANQGAIRANEPLSGSEREELQRLRDAIEERQTRYAPSSTLTAQESATTSAAAGNPTSPVGPQHWDDASKQWVSNETGQPINQPA